MQGTVLLTRLRAHSVVVIKIPMVIPNITRL